MKKIKTNIMELDLTYLCNLNCNNCTRRCDLLPGKKDHADINNIKKQLISVADGGHHFSKIFVMGGEPALYPHLEDLIDFFVSYCEKNNTKICFVTNYSTEKIRRITDALPAFFDIRRSRKDGSDKLSTRPDDFWTMNIAPKDFPEFFSKEDYSDGCAQQKRCGVQLATNNKWYPCTMSGGIDRIFKLGIGCDSFFQMVQPEVFNTQLNELCGLCGRFRMRYAPYRKKKCLETEFKDRSVYPAFVASLKQWPLHSGQQLLSPSWQQAIEKYRKEMLSPV